MKIRKQGRFMRKSILGSVFFFCFFTGILAQGLNKIRGTVTDTEGETLIGATVAVKGTTRGTITDTNGGYEIEAAKNATLVFSFIGYQKQEMMIGDKSQINAVLSEDSKLIDEVVVVGYGVQKKVNLSGSVDALKGKNLSKKNTLQTSQALQGMAPGVTVTSKSGKPGKEGTEIRIRGIGTLNDNNPLVLIDGVTSSIDAVDPNDIESMSILKDAASSAIYGSRAANGVILITTKRGKTDKVAVTYKGSVSSTSPRSLPKLTNAWDYMTLYDEAISNDTRKDDGTPGGIMYGQELIDKWKNATDRDEYPNSNIMDEVYKDHSMQYQHYLSLSAGTEKFNTNTSVNYSWQDGLINKMEYKRYGVRSNNDFKVNDFLKFGADLSIRKTKSEDPTNANAEIEKDNGTSLEQLMRLAPIYATRYSNGIWGGGYAGSGNPMMSIEEGLDMLYEDWQEVLGVFRTTVTPFKGMRLDFSYAPKINDYKKKSVNKTMPIYDYKTGLVTYEPKIKNNMSRVQEQTLENDINLLANYNVSLGNHDISVLGGYQYLTHHKETLVAYRDNNPFQQYEELNVFSPENQTNSGRAVEWALMSYFGRINYAYQSKYLLEANIRYDGSSRFAEGYKWGVFPSFSAAWRFSAESFMKDISWLSNGKLRASWGELGNQSGLGEYPYSLNISTAQYGVFAGEMAPGYAATNYAIRDISWESTRMLNFGADFGFLNNKLTAGFDWYHKRTYDILLEMPIPYIMGYSNSPRQNIGTVDNKGWDLTLSHNNKVGDFQYQVTGVLSDVKNEVVEMGGKIINSGIYTSREGYPINSIYGLYSEGYFSSFQEARNSPVSQWGKLQGGDLKYKDIDDNKKIDNSDRDVIGNSIPRWCYSLDFQASYKGFDMSLFFQGVGKRDSYVRGFLAYPLGGAITPQQKHMDRWNEANPNPNAKYPRLSENQQQNNTQTSTFWLRSGAYMRLKNVQLGYTIPKQLIQKTSISNCRVYVSGNNLFTIHHMDDGIDPEAPDQAQNTYPIISTYTFGVEVSF